MKMRIIPILAAVVMCGTFNSAAYAVPDDSILSQTIREADGTSGQATNSGSGVKTGHIQDGAVTDAKISGPISSGKIEKAANVLVVAKSGGDFTSIQAAINSINPSADSPYLIKVMPGKYTENVVMKSYIHLQGSGQDITTIESATQGAQLLAVENKTSVTITGFTLKGGDRGVMTYATTSLKIAGNKFTGNSIGVTIAYAPDASSSVINNIFTGNAGSGIEFQYSSSGEVTGNTVTGNGSHGIMTISSSPLITRNTVTGNAGVGVYVYDQSTPTIAENIIAGNGCTGIYVISASPSITHNKVTGNGRPWEADISFDSASNPNVSFNVYDRLLGGGRGLGQYNVKSDGSLAPAP